MAETHKTEIKGQYLYFSKKSKSLCLQLEQLTAEQQYYQLSFNLPEQVRIMNEKNLIKYKLETLWDKQVDRFSIINKKNNGKRGKK